MLCINVQAHTYEYATQIPFILQGFVINSGVLGSKSSGIFYSISFFTDNNSL